jgi:hypothetical protein
MLMDAKFRTLCEGLYGDPKQAIPERLARLEEYLFQNRNEVLDYLEHAQLTTSSYRFELIDAMTQQADRWQEVLLDEFERLCLLAERDPASKSEALKALDAFALLAEKPNSFAEKFHSLLAGRSRTSDQALALSLVDVMADHLYKLKHSKILLHAMQDLATKSIDPSVRKMAGAALREVQELPAPEALTREEANVNKSALNELHLQNSRTGNLVLAVFYILLSVAGMALYIKKSAVVILLPAIVLAGLGIWKMVSAFNRQIQISIDRTCIRTTKRFISWKNIANERVVSDTSGSTYLQFEDIENGSSLQMLKLDNYSVPTQRIEEVLNNSRAEHDGVGH